MNKALYLKNIGFIAYIYPYFFRNLIEFSTCALKKKGKNKNRQNLNFFLSKTYFIAPLFIILSWFSFFSLIFYLIFLSYVWPLNPLKIKLGPSPVSQMITTSFSSRIFLSHVWPAISLKIESLKWSMHIEPPCFFDIACFRKIFPAIFHEWDRGENWMQYSIASPGRDSVLKKRVDYFKGPLISFTSDYEIKKKANHYQGLS